MSYVRELKSLVGHRPLIIAGAAVLIFNKDNCLLMQYRKDNRKWGLIGGSMEIGESLAETARREALEETSLELNELNWFDLFSGKEVIYQLPHGDVVVNVTAVYTSSQFKERLRVNEAESLKLRFFKLNELPKNISPPDRPIIERYLHQYQHTI